MQLPSWRVALGAHDGHLLAFPCHINNNQCMPHALNLSRRIYQHIARLDFTNRTWLRFMANGKSAAHLIGMLQKLLQCRARAAALILKRIAVDILEQISE